MTTQNILFTGGSGLLGREMKKIIPDAFFPSSKDFDITDVEGMSTTLEVINQIGDPIKTMVHMAAFTSPPKIDQDPMKALAVNVVGTANVVTLCQQHNIRLVYISTDYVFSGEKGNYGEEDPIYPVNKYAWSKLGGECAVRLYDNHAIIRLSFGQNEFPYPAAYVDQWTSRLPVKEIVSKITRIIRSDFLGTIHIGSKPRTVYEYAKSISPDKDIKEISIKDSKTKIPRDTSLNTAKFDAFISGGW